MERDAVQTQSEVRAIANSAMMAWLTIVPMTIARAQEPLRVAVAETRIQATDRPWFGFSIACTDCTRKETPSGAQWTFTVPPTILDIERGSPAQVAGMRAGDVVTHIDGLSLTSQAGVERLAAIRAGQTAIFRVSRGTERLELTLTAAGYPARYGQVVQGTVGGMARSSGRAQGRLADAAPLRGDTLVGRLLPQRRDSLRIADTLNVRGRIGSTQGRSAGLGRGIGVGGATRSFGTDTTVAMSAGRGVGGSVARTTVASEPPLRFSGGFGNTSVSVRGPANTTVTIADRECWMEIRSGDAVVRLELRDGCRRSPPGMP